MVQLATTTEKNFDPIAAHATMVAIRNRLLSGDKSIKAQDLKDIINVYNAWILHTHVTSDGHNTGTPLLPAQLVENVVLSLTTPGTYYWYVPSTSPMVAVALKAIGAGGGGGGAYSGGSDTVGGGGGAGGILDTTLYVPAGTKLTLTVGAGGTAGPAWGGPGQSGGTGSETHILVPGVADLHMYGGVGGNGHWYGGVGGVGPSSTGATGGNGINGNIGGNGASSIYSAWFNTATSGGGARYTGGAGHYGGGGGGGGGSHDGRDRNPGGKGGDGFLSISLPAAGVSTASFPNIATGKNITLPDVQNLIAMLNNIRSHTHQII